MKSIYTLKEYATQISLSSEFADIDKPLNSCSFIYKVIRQAQ